MLSSASAPITPKVKELRHSREMTLLCSRNLTQQPAFGGDDIAFPIFGLRTKARRLRWVTLSEQKWVILAERRGRNGLRFGDMTSRQREAALALVAAALSREGYQKVTDIMNGDEVLKNAGGGRTGGRQGGAGTAAAGRRGGGVRFGLDEYYIALLGTPSATAAWMIQFGGHHLAI